MILRQKNPCRVPNAWTKRLWTPQRPVRPSATETMKSLNLYPSIPVYRSTSEDWSSHTPSEAANTGCLDRKPLVWTKSIQIHTQLDGGPAFSRLGPKYPKSAALIYAYLYQQALTGLLQQNKEASKQFAAMAFLPKTTGTWSHSGSRPRGLSQGNPGSRTC